MGLPRGRSEEPWRRFISNTGRVRHEISAGALRSLGHCPSPHKLLYPPLTRAGHPVK